MCHRPGACHSGVLGSNRTAKVAPRVRCWPPPHFTPDSTHQNIGGRRRGAAAHSDGLVLTDEFRHALGLLAGGRHVFLTGKAGTGKSTLIRLFMAETDRAVVVVAPTGIAALNVDGYTIHRLFGFRTTTTLDDVRGGAYRPGRFAKTLASLQTLIIDEASMVRADVFDMVASALSRFGPQPGTPFGGVQIVLVGDLYQLPPVVGDGEAAFFSAGFSTAYETPYFFSARSFRRDGLPNRGVDDGVPSAR